MEDLAGLWFIVALECTIAMRWMIISSAHVENVSARKGETDRAREGWREGERESEGE